jgi:hypothetical protein
MNKTVEINGKQVLDFTPDNARELALVDLKVLIRLAGMLETSNFSNIRHSLRVTIVQSDNLEQLVEACEDFSSFHRSVNLISSFGREEVTTNMDSLEPNYENHL